MTDDTIDFRQFAFMQTRIPVKDALEAFIPLGAEPDGEMRALVGRTGFSRWFPVDGGHRVLTLYEGGPYDPMRFTLVKGGWDHEHCARCQGRVQPMTLSWVTRTGRFILLDEKCYAEVFGPPSLTPD